MMLEDHKLQIFLVHWLIMEHFIRLSELSNFNYKKNIGLYVIKLFIPIPSTIDGCTHYQYKTGKHSSKKRRIIGSTKILSQLDNGNIIEVCHTFLKGSSERMLGRDNTRKAHAEQVEHHALTISACCKAESIILIDHERLSNVLCPHLASKRTNNLQLLLVL